MPRLQREKTKEPRFQSCDCWFTGREEEEGEEEKKMGKEQRTFLIGVI